MKHLRIHEPLPDSYDNAALIDDKAGLLDVKAAPFDSKPLLFDNNGALFDDQANVRCQNGIINPINL